MRVLVRNYSTGEGSVRIFSERPFGYRRYIVEWRSDIQPDYDSTQMYSGLWYKEKDVIEEVEKTLHFAGQL